MPSFQAQQIEWFMGIDPGQNGGIAVVQDDGTLVAVYKMPATEADVYLKIKTLAKASIRLAIIEKVHSMPNQGVSSTFKFGVGYGGLRMALVANQIAFDEAVPRTWQKALGVPARNTKTETKNDHKKKLLAKAQQLFPTEDITLATADAILIAEYCRRKHGRIYASL